MMLSAHKIRGSQIEYYVRYAARGAETFWLGQGAADLGLTGHVDPEVFLALSRGEAPDGGRLLERVAADRTPGWDLTLSAPKSVSLAWALADEPLRERLAAAHREAAAAAFAFLEREGGRARRGLGGRDGHVEAGLAVACFTHPASRELDPQLHTHGIVLNVAHGEDARWTALDSRTIYLHRRAAGAIYRAELRERVAELGGVWKALDRRGLAELEGFTPETLRAFSQRRTEIEAMLDASGSSGRAASEAACLATRHDKVEVELEALRSAWFERADELGWDTARVQALLDGEDRRAPFDADGERREHDRFIGPRGLTQHDSAFTRDDAVVAWAEAHPQGARLGTLDRLTDTTLSRPEIVPLVVADEEGRPITTSSGPVRSGIIRLARSPASGIEMLVCERRYSTTELLATEAHVLELANAGKDKGVGRVRKERLDAVLAARSYLSEEQAAMVRAICESGDAVRLVVGVPGSGKTFALEAARAAWLADGYRVVGAALAAEAATQLEAGSKIASTTLDRLLYELSLARGVAGNTRLDHRTVVVVDEASMIDTRRLSRLLDHANRSGAKVVLTGDDRQLPSIEAGGAFAALVRQVGASRLRVNARQVESWERSALTALREGRAGEAAGAYRRHGRVHLAEEPGVLLEQMVESWWTSRRAGEVAVLYAYAREAARVLNRMARARADSEGLLSGPELMVEEWSPGDLAERSYRVGDEVCCLRNRSRLGAKQDSSGRGVRNGTRGTVVWIDKVGGGLSLATTDGRQITLPEEYVRRFTDYGYAWTLHKGQGQTVGQASRGVEEEELRRRGRAFVFGAESLTAEAALVAASRATDATELFVLVDPDEAPESPAAEAEVLGRAWARSEHQHLAQEEIDAAAEIAYLATAPRVELAKERDAVVALIGPGPATDLRWREDDARRLLGAAIVHLDEVIEKERANEREVADPDTFDHVNARADLRAARSRRATAERETREAHDDALAVDEAIVQQAHTRRRQGSDVRTALDRLELLDSALSTKRARDIDELATNPPAYVVDLIGIQPSEYGRAQRWRQGLVEIEDWRRSIPTAISGDGDDPWLRALGPSLDGWHNKRRLRVAVHIHAIRRELGVSNETSGSGSMSARNRESATNAILKRQLPRRDRRQTPAIGRTYPQRKVDLR
jgi:conjugative relaxase-like TrwC/TraI family protein